MDSRLVIRQIKNITDSIANNSATPDQIASAFENITQSLHNPYLLCLPRLINTCKGSNIDVSTIVNKIQALKNEVSR